MSDKLIKKGVMSAEVMALAKCTFTPTELIIAEDTTKAEWEIIGGQLRMMDKAILQSSKKVPDQHPSKIK